MNFRALNKEHDEDIDFLIEYVNSPLRFEVDCSTEGYNYLDCRNTVLAKGFPLSDFHTNEFGGNWVDINTIYEEFALWLNNVVKEYIDEQTLPDLWAQLEQQREFIPSAKMEKDDTLPYSEEEKAQIRLSINEFRLQIVNNFKPDDYQLKVIDDRLRYLSEALDRLNRVDWKAVAITSIISFSMALSLDTEKGKLLFNLFKQIFSKVVYLLN